jgi:hypothetical protein
MKEIDKRSFTHNGKTYEVRVYETNDRGYVLRTFLNGKRANPYSYSVDTDTNEYFRWDTGLEAFQHLMDIAEQDVKNETWEKYRAAVSKEQ